MKILVIDNFDSFVNNICQYLREEGQALSGSEFVLEKQMVDLVNPEVLDDYDGVVISPGPGVPEDYPQLWQVLDRLSEKGNIPVLGVCMGLQVMAVYFGASLYQLEAPRHGFASRLEKVNGIEDPLLKGISSGHIVGRYHSWAVNLRESELYCSTRSAEDGIVMSAFHPRLPFYGLQFHPESCITESGRIFIRNFLNLCRNQSLNV